MSAFKLVDDELNAAYWCLEFDECYDTLGSWYPDDEKLDDVARRLQLLLDRLKALEALR